MSPRWNEMEGGGGLCLTVKVDGAITIQINLTNDLGDLFVRDAGVRLAHHAAKLVGGDIAAAILVLFCIISNFSTQGSG